MNLEELKKITLRAIEEGVSELHDVVVDDYLRSVLEFIEKDEGVNLRFSDLSLAAKNRERIEVWTDRYGWSDCGSISYRVFDALADRFGDIRCPCYRVVK